MTPEDKTRVSDRETSMNMSELPVYLLTVYTPTYPSTHLPTHLPVYLSTCLPTHLSIQPPTHRPNYLPTYVFYMKQISSLIHSNFKFFNYYILCITVHTLFYQENM